MASFINTAGTEFKYVPGACRGAYAQVRHNFDAGSSTSWSHDVDFWLDSSTQGNDIAQTSRTRGVKFTGYNGVKHEMHVAIGHDSGIYPQDCITGFKFKYYAMSGSRKIYPRKWGFGLRKMTNNDQWLYSIGTLSQPSSSGDITKSHTFNSTALSYLSSGYCFEELHLELSTDNCCSNNDSDCYIFGFEFKYKAPSGAKLIIPSPRPFTDRHKYKIA